MLGHGNSGEENPGHHIGVVAAPAEAEIERNGDDGAGAKLGQG